MNEKEIRLTVSVEETNVILEALGNLSFAKVYALVAKIQSQAAEQLREKEAEPPETGEPETEVPYLREASSAA